MYDDRYASYSVDHLNLSGAEEGLKEAFLDKYYMISLTSGI